MKRFLFAYADTEGIPMRKGSNLWNFCMIINSIVKVDMNHQIKHIYKRPLYHVLHFAHEKNDLETKNVQHSLKTHFNSIKYLHDLYDTEGLVLACWNAPHDKNVLSRYLPKNEKIIWLDLLKYFKQSNPGFSSYKLKDIVSNTTSDNKTQVRSHTALGDALSMMKNVKI